jgi:hypothetical protein
MFSENGYTVHELEIVFFSTFLTLGGSIGGKVGKCAPRMSTRTVEEDSQFQEI